ncbi:MAG: HAMP domain-containing histidine kinase [Alphaproteobacteria bacterium]|nr:HAMP domain-containing histidine kinase [Alphaproteobacteria bacterium]
MQDAIPKPPSLLRGLSARLLLLTIGFVMLSEVLIYAPSVARFRVDFLRERVNMAYLASLALKATPNFEVSDDLEQELLIKAGVHVIVLRRPEIRTLMLTEAMPPSFDASYDLRRASYLDLLLDGVAAVLRDQQRVIRVVDHFPDGTPGAIELLLDEPPLIQAVRDYSVNILRLSVLISVVTAGLVYLALHILIVRPMHRLAIGMARFRAAPEDDAIEAPRRARGDEIGDAERQFQHLQTELRRALRQKTRLATLGGAVSKINHDLRNMLATAQLVSDRLTQSDDPTVRRIAPTLVRSIDRAVSLCTETLNFGRAEDAEPRRGHFPLAELADDVASSAGLSFRGDITFHNRVPNDLIAYADREQLFRALLNLVRNAAEALQGGGSIALSAEMQGGRLVIEVADTGPGLPEQARERLFRPFAGSARAGGIGLGLVIARDLVRAHGGELSLAGTGEQGTSFRIVLPGQIAGLRRELRVVS